MGDAGFAIGLVIGISIGFAAGRKHKPWSELTVTEKRLRIGLVGLLAILVVATIVVFLIRS